MVGGTSIFEGGAIRRLADAPEDLPADTGRVLPGGRNLNRIDQTDVIPFKLWA